MFTREIYGLHALNRLLIDEFKYFKMKIFKSLNELMFKRKAMTRYFIKRTSIIKM